MYKCGACGGSYSSRTLTPHALICEEEGGGSVMPHILGKSKIKLKYIQTPYGGTFVRDLEAEMEEDNELGTV